MNATVSRALADYSDEEIWTEACRRRDEIARLSPAEYRERFPLIGELRDEIVNKARQVIGDDVSAYECVNSVPESGRFTYDVRIRRMESVFVIGIIPDRKRIEFEHWLYHAWPRSKEWRALSLFVSVE